MHSISRLALSLVAGLTAFTIAYWLPGAFLGDDLQWAAGALAMTVAGLAVWHGSGSRHALLKGAVLGAAWGGSIGFACGFFGPMIFTPESNLGPMIGIILTGPAGTLLGAAAGLAIAAGKPG